MADTAATFTHTVSLYGNGLPPFSCPSSLEYLRPRALILLKTWRYFLLYKLFTYLLVLLTYIIVQYDNLRQSAIFLMFT